MPKYLTVDQPQASRTQAVLSGLAPDLDISSERPALTITTCCLFHCGQCLRCFKSKSGLDITTVIFGSACLSPGALSSMYVMTAIDGFVGLET